MDRIQEMEDMVKTEIRSEFNGSTRKGPPNRMNDLAYKDWMKFQKSFFWYSTDQALIDECVDFFTKSVWPDNTPSATLILGFREFNPGAMSSQRIIEHKAEFTGLEDLTEFLQMRVNEEIRYDFVLVDLRSFIDSQNSLKTFLSEFAPSFFKALKGLLIPQRYCGIVVETEKIGGGGFPLPWAVALSCRGHLRLRDEKVGLVKDSEQLLYCLFMQAERDERPPFILSPSKIRYSKLGKVIPTWTIPKPPPRKKGELLHPAKFPETLIQEFIELFTEPGDNVLDPMVGTGSAVIACIRTNRNGWGIELNPEYVEISRRRIQQENTPMLFEDMQSKTKAVVVKGNASRLNEIGVISKIKFKYAVTSPPYWSMLTNPGSENQEARRNKNLPLVYSENKKDLGNIEDYDGFLDGLETIYRQLASKLEGGGYLTVIVKNVKRNHIVYPLAWDLAVRLSKLDGDYDYLGATLWCQDDIGLKPFAVGIHWVSNTLHQYCLHFRKRGSVKAPAKNL